MADSVEDHGRNAVLPDWAPKKTQGATLTLARPMQFSLRAGTHVASVDVRIASITSALRVRYGVSSSRDAAEKIAVELAREMYERDHGALPFRNIGVQTLVFYKEKSVTAEIFVQPKEETRKVTMNL